MQYTRKQIIKNFESQIHGLLLDVNKASFGIMNAIGEFEKELWKSTREEEEKNLANCVFYLAMALGEVDKLSSMENIEYIFSLYPMRIDYTGFCNIEFC